MAPVKKQKPNKSPKSKKTQNEEVQNADESVISGQLQKKINKKQQKPKKDPKGVVFIKHLPHGFFEEQLKKYFEQFGNVTRVRLARSRRTGTSKGYAFVEFEYPEVAQVAAETMDNYLMFKKIVKAAYIPPEKQQFNYFRTSLKKIRNKSGKTVWVSSKTASIQQKMKKHNDWSEENFQKRTAKQLAKLKKLNEKYAHLGIDVNELTVQPKTVSEDENKAQEKSKIKADKQVEAGSSKALKRKPVEEQKASGKQQNSKKSKKKVSLEDLLGNTIQEDSEDEDYIAMAEDSDDDNAANDESSDEETYGFTKDSDNEEVDEEDEEDNDEEEEFVPKKAKTKFGKSLKSSNVERFEQLLKRKPHTGGVQKLNKKSLKQPKQAAKNKSNLQITAAKELAKPLSKVKKGKLGKPLKTNKTVKKVK